MQRFKDSVTGKIWDFEDDVIPVLDENGTYTFKSADGTLLYKVPMTLQFDPDAADPVSPPVAVYYVSAATVRNRLQALGLWAATASALAAQPELGFWFSTLTVGVASNDAVAKAFLTSVGADPDEILAPA